MLTQLKANASSVTTTLGRGRHSFIGAILSSALYVNLTPLTPFISLTHPVTLIFPPNSTQHAITLLKTQHDNAMRIYLLYLLVQRALVQQVLDDIESKYLTYLRNRFTGKVLNDIHALLFQLFKAYGKITTKNLREKYEKMASM